MSISDFRLAPSMWWHIDLPAAQLAPGETEALPDTAQGESLLDWILPSLRDDIDPAGDKLAIDIDGSERRDLRRRLRDRG